MGDRRDAAAQPGPLTWPRCSSPRRHVGAGAPPAARRGAEARPHRAPAPALGGRVLGVVGSPGGAAPPRRPSSPRAARGRFPGKGVSTGRQERPWALQGTRAGEGGGCGGTATAPTSTLRLCAAEGRSLGTRGLTMRGAHRIAALPFNLGRENKGFRCTHPPRYPSFSAVVGCASSTVLVVVAILTVSMDLPL